MQRVKGYFQVGTVLAVLLAATLALGNTRTVLSDGDEQVSVALDNGILTIVSHDGSETSTQVIDLEAMGQLATTAVDEALVGLDDLFDGLQGLQLQCRLGQDNRVNLTCDDKEFELDLDQVMAQVASAVQSGLQELDTSDWTNDWTNEHERWSEATDEDLRQELADLKGEMEGLRVELRNLQKAQDKR